MLKMKVMFPDFSNIETPFYYYDTDLLDRTIDNAKAESENCGFQLHYALKANTNKRILNSISEKGLGADCVSGNEILAAIECGFKTKDIVFAGVGKTDNEIEIALHHNIFSINCESIEEISVIDQIASKLGRKARIALRLNPLVNASTHKYITTGTQENKFGIGLHEIPLVMNLLRGLKNIELIGLHFHIGSQITNLKVFKELCLKVNEIQKWFFDRNIALKHINLGGGLGVDYENPDESLIPDFKGFFNNVSKNLLIMNNQKVHFELGRSIVAQSGSLVTKVLYVKDTGAKKFVVVDAGMTELIRPALYKSYHKIQNVSSTKAEEIYDIVGPICETSDYLGENIQLPETQRGDLLIIRSCGAYGEVMSSSYNLRNKAKSYFSEHVQIELY